VLGPSQNHSFRDHYLEISCLGVMFIATSNQLGTAIRRCSTGWRSFLARPHRGRRSTSRGSTGPRQLDEHGLTPEQVTIDDSAVRRLIVHTREAGVRNLERQIGAVSRKRAVTAPTRPTHAARA
jgi:ATP-dependent Lon protease